MATCGGGPKRLVNHGGGLFRFPHSDSTGSHAKPHEEADIASIRALACCSSTDPPASGGILSGEMRVDGGPRVGEIALIAGRLRPRGRGYSKSGTYSRLWSVDTVVGSTPWSADRSSRSSARRSPRIVGKAWSRAASRARTRPRRYGAPTPCRKSTRLVKIRPCLTSRSSSRRARRLSSLDGHLP